MMQTKAVIFSLPLQQFSLSFQIDVRTSVESTKALQPEGINDFIFVAGSIWLNRNDAGAVLLLDDWSAGNLIETLAVLRRHISSPARIVNLERKISVGGWGRWMSGYWERLNADCSADEDEETYDLLRAALIADSKSGCIAAYQYKDIPILEACVHPIRESTIFVYSQFEADVLENSIKDVASRLVDAVRARL